MQHDILFTPLRQHMIIEVTCRKEDTDEKVLVKAAGAAGDTVSIIRSPDRTSALIIEWDS